MKLLHTSDWHLGKRLYGRERIETQARVLEEIARTAAAEGVDLIVVSGDIFDTAMPSSLAEELFYRAAVELSKVATLLVIAGNHDDPERLAATKELARLNDIIIVGDYGVPARTDSVTACGEGWLRLCVNGETVNVVVLPYPSDARTGDIIKEGETYADRVRARLFSAAEAAFSVSGINLTVSHLFCAGGIKSGSERDIELGTARIVPLDCLPSADYTALGHIHKNMCLGADKTVCYPGAPMQFTFEENADKYVNLVQIEGGVTTVSTVALKEGQRLLSFVCTSVDEALGRLAQNQSALVEIVLRLPAALLSSQSKSLRACKNLAHMRLEIDAGHKRELGEKEHKSMEQIFTEYCAQCKVEPKRELVDLFLSLMGEV